MNAIITTVCNRSCDYCFATGTVEHEQSEVSRSRMVSLGEFVKIVDFAVASGQRSLSLLGGEPTLHPHFREMLLYLYARDFKVTVFTNGMVRPKLLAQLASLVNRDCTHFVLNLNHPDSRSAVEERRVADFLAEFSTSTGISLNIYRPDMDLSFVIDTVRAYDLSRPTRIGIAHPAPGEATHYLQLEDFAAAMHQMSVLIADLDDAGKTVSIDCGFPLCLLDDATVGKLFRRGRPGRVPFRCQPVVDVGPGLEAWACYPLACLGKVSIEEFKDQRAMRSHFKEKYQEVYGGRFTGIFPECESCDSRKRRMCAGGCSAHPQTGPAEDHDVQAPAPT